MDVADEAVVAAAHGVDEARGVRVVAEQRAKSETYARTRSGVTFRPD
jgi:hypothetical protein